VNEHQGETRFYGPWDLTNPEPGRPRATADFQDLRFRDRCQIRRTSNLSQNTGVAAYNSFRHVIGQPLNGGSGIDSDYLTLCLL
jgi:hypothetical protein